MNFVRSHILVCTGTGCSSSNSPAIIEAFEQELKAQGMDQEVRVVKTGCFGLCAMGPVVLVYPEGAFYTHVTVPDVAEIVSEHIVKGRIVQRLLHKEGDAAEFFIAKVKEGKMSQVEEKLEARKKAIAGKWKDNTDESMAYAKEPVILKNGNYIMLAVHADMDEAKAEFDRLTKDK